MALLRDLQLRRPAWPAAPKPGTLVAIFRLLLPSFVANIFWPEHRTSHRLYATSYLDGLRGIASFLVFFCHYTEENHGPLVATFGIDHEGNPAPSSLLQLPFARILFSGRPMVHIFFVISGFALSFKPIGHIHSREPDKAFHALSSSVFRRPFRLFGPCIVSTLIIALLIQGNNMHDRPREWSVLMKWWRDAVFGAITWPWSWDTDLRPAFDIHLWTIPIEFVHSMLLFLVILMLARVRLRIRQATNFGLMVYCLCCGKWAGFEFLAGLFLAELFIIDSGAAKSPWANEVPSAGPRRRRVWAKARTAFQVFAMVAAFFVGGWPNTQQERTPGISWLVKITPDPWREGEQTQKFWFAISAVFVVWGSGELGPVRRFLENSFSQYLGYLSYAIYIVHGPVLIVLEERGWMGRPSVPARGVPGDADYVAPVDGMGVRYYFPGSSPMQRTLCWAAGLVVMTPVAVWAADVFWRLVDVPIVAFARKVETFCLDKTLVPEPPARADRQQAAEVENHIPLLTSVTHQH